MSSIRLVRSAADVAFAEHLRVDLSLRQWSVELTGFATGGDVARPGASTVAVVPDQTTGDFDAFLVWMSAATDAGAAPILILPEQIDLPTRVHTEAGAIVLRTGLTYDRVFEDLARTLLDAFPAWLDVRVRPTLIQNPTGVAWWSDDLHVADDRFEHAVRVGANDSTVVVPGLDYPQHLSLRHRHLAIANKGADELLECDIVDNMSTNIQSTRSLDGLTLSRPHDVRISSQLSVIADTGNNRVLLSSPDHPSWQAVVLSRPLSSPEGLCLDRSGFWIADTQSDRVVKCDADGRELLSYGTRGDGPGQFALPVGICRWRDLLFVAEEGNERVQVLRVSDDESGGVPSLTPLQISLADGFVGQPLGLNVNRNNRLAVSDRKRKCIWLVDLLDWSAEL